VGKYIVVTQDTQALPCVAKDATRNLLRRAKSGGLGQVATKKKSTEKNGITRPILTVG